MPNTALFLFVSNNYLLVKKVYNLRIFHWLESNPHLYPGFRGHKENEKVNLRLSFTTLQLRSDLNAPETTYITEFIAFDYHFHTSFTTAFYSYFLLPVNKNY